MFGWGSFLGVVATTLISEMTHRYCFMIRGGGFEGFGSQSELHLGALSVLFKRGS